MGNLTKNFSREQFSCSCGCGLDTPTETFLDSLQRLRDICGREIFISGGLRCKKKNSATKGASRNSRHLPQYRDAADIKIKGSTVAEMVSFALQIPEFRNGGIGIYTNRIHVDTRGSTARWPNKMWSGPETYVTYSNEVIDW